jgi:hypothetical protein
MVLLFDMVLSLLALSNVASFKTTWFRIYSRSGLYRRKFSGSLRAN